MGAIVALAVLLGSLSYGHCVELTQPGSMVVKPGQSLTISCKLSGYSVTDGSYSTHWIRQPAGKALEWIGRYWKSDANTAYKDSLKSKFTISVDTSSSTVTLQGSNLQTGDTAVYYCARDGGNSYGYFDYWGKGTKVTVTSGTKSPPSVFPLISCGPGSSGYVTVGCMAKDFTPDLLTFKWNRKGGAALADTDFLQYPSVQSGEVFTAVSHAVVKAADWNQKQAYECSAEYDGKSTTVEIKMPEAAPPQSAHLYIMAPSQDELKYNKTATFACFASEFSPKDHSFVWRWRGEEISKGITTLPAVETKADKKTVYSATSILHLPESQWRESETYVSCEFKHRGGNVQRTAHYVSPGCIPANPVEVSIIPPSNEELFLNERVELMCNVTGKLENIDSVEWHNEEGKTLVSTKESVGGSEIHKLYIDIADWSNGTTFTCIVKHFDSPDPIKVTYRRENGNDPRPPSVFLMTTTAKNNGHDVTLICYAKGFYPKEVLFSWRADDKPVNRAMFQTTQVVKTERVYSVYSQLSISAEDWNNGIMYSCVVHHEAAFDKLSKTIVRTIDSVSKKSTTVSLDLCRPQNCEA
nr:immunoglobulin heavy chain [Anguilla anguilla]